jgi:hypothetical protein
MVEFIVEQALDFLHEFLRRVIYHTVLKRAAPEPKARRSKSVEHPKAAEKPAARRKRRGASAGQMLFNVALVVAAVLVLRQLLRRRASG